MKLWASIFQKNNYQTFLQTFDVCDKFVLEDLYVELVDELSDSNNQILYSLLDDDENVEKIDKLVPSKIDKSSDEKYYLKKEVPKDFNADAVDIATMDPYDFEDLCKSLLEHENHADVHRKGGNGDLGVDILTKWFNGNASEAWLMNDSLFYKNRKNGKR